MRSTALAIIRDEHRVLSAMLQSMSLLLRQCRAARQPPDFRLLRTMLFYVDEYPNRLHHPKEEALLFPRVRRECPDLAEVLDQLSDDHQQGERSMHQLEHALLAYEVMGDERRAAFEQALDRYTAFYLRHMMLEERHVLRAAEERFSPEDWAELDEAFAGNRDPFTGHEPEEPFRPLYQHILASLPDPLGYKRSA
ncbi:hemerythrin domain-containing protein [Ideonella sp. BN130291]|uniref:hemerythrin domain-containing protein n=1 Tax=Ideonella sp. BN130291 TaxID=3112940 RepID=UPI002E26C7D2|nr:hemerythrin domain-containing protein [Ideonella sp. BN130291]